MAMFGHSLAHTSSRYSCPQSIYGGTLLWSTLAIVPVNECTNQFLLSWCINNENVGLIIIN